jgi:PAS domain S-box-containing protein
LNRPEDPVNPIKPLQDQQPPLSADPEPISDAQSRHVNRLVEELRLAHLELEHRNRALKKSLQQAESAAYEAERFHSMMTSLIDISFDSYLEVDTTGRLRLANEAYAKASGYSVSELLNLHVSELEANENPQQVRAHLEKVIAQGSDLFETRHRRKDGRLFEIEISVTYLPEYRLFCCFCRDITARKLSEAKLAAIINASVDAIITYDSQNRIDSANPSIEKIFGFKPEELKGSLISKILPFYSGRGPRNHRLPANQTISPITESTGIHKDGTKISVEISRAEYRFDDAGYFVAIVRDVSLRKQRELQDKAHLDELAHITRLGLMGQMASGIAHEVNQPLTAICNYTQASINLMKTEHYDQGLLADILHKTQNQALRAGSIIHRMRAFIDSSPKQCSNIDIGDLIRESVNMCLEDIKKHSVRLAFHFEKNLPMLCVDRIQIEQVLINLIRNSIEALQNRPEQQRQLSIQTQLTADNSVQVRVKDNGPGIDQRRQQKIFMPFFTTKPSGMGMGLSICRSLIEAHNGKLRFCSQAGKGTTFYFTIPAETDMADDSAVQNR